MAIRHMELAGISKAYGAHAALADMYLPLGEGVAVLEKAVKTGQANLQMVKAQCEQAQQMHEQANAVLEMTGVFLDRMEAESGNARKTARHGFGEYVPGSQVIVKQEANGHGQR
jgi:hypothetical protein